MKLDFENPEETLNYLTSTDIDYQKLIEDSQVLMDKISEPHTNTEGRKFQSITQCILECYRIIKNFESRQWISESKLKNELKPKQAPIKFTRINADGETCEYRIINTDQIDFTKEIEFADEFKIVSSPKLQTKTKTPDDDKNEFNKVLTLLQNGENVFLTGYAGTGKSYILNKLKETFKKKLTVTSTTGIAAVNVRGQTLHSWAGVGLCKNPIHKTVEKIRTRMSALKQILNCKILAVDEISMLSIETFEYVDAVLKSVRNSLEPFGGIQVLFIGDFFQFIFSIVACLRYPRTS